MLDSQRADFAALFQHDDADFLSTFTFELLDAYGSAETGWTGSDNANVDLILNALDGFWIVSVFVSCRR